MVGVNIFNSLAKENDPSHDKKKLVDGDAVIDVVEIKDGLEDSTVVAAGVRQRKKQASGLLICVSVVLLLICITVGGWLLYDFFNRTPRSWHRTCKYRLKPTQIDDGEILFDHGGLVAFDDGNNHLLPPVVKDNNDVPNPIIKDNRQEFLQDINVDVKNNLATIDVPPQLDISNRIRVVHDFQNNITAIRDFTLEQCFITPLDRERIPNPANLIDTFLMMMSGNYLPDNELIRKTMKVQMPALTEKQLLEAYGPVVAEECNGIKAYRLVKKTAEEEKIAARQRREARRSPYVYSVGRTAFAVDVD